MANSGNIVKARCNFNFTTVYNDVIRDERLSLRARGLLIYLISLPDDWVIHKSYLDKQIFPDVDRVDENGVRLKGEKREGRDAVFSAFDELVFWGYILVVKKINANNGRLEGFDYVVYNSNQADNRKTENPISDFPIMGNPQLTKEIVKGLNSKQNKEINIPFGDFWNLYEKKRGNAAKLEAKWNKLKDEERQAIMDYIPKYKQAQPDKQYRKDPATFLNNRAWEDEIIGMGKGTHAPPKRVARQWDYYDYQDYVDACNASGVTPEPMEQ